MSNNNQDRVQILLSTYNGEKYLDAQIESLLNQEDVYVNILVRDDGSTDGTISKLKKWEKKCNLAWYQGKNIGPAQSFIDLVKKTPISEYYAFCDQDDIWKKDKLKIALKKLKSFETNKPSLYFSNLKLVKEDLTYIRTTNHNPRITLGSALIINPAAGCTEVFNLKLLRLLKTYTNPLISMHDSWVYKVCVALNGDIFFDSDAHILYRQHGNNVIGGTSTIFSTYKRRFKNTILFRKRVREKEALELIYGYSDIIPKENLKKIKKVAYYREGLKKKLDLIMDRDFRTNKFEHRFCFICAVLFEAL